MAIPHQRTLPNFWKGSLPGRSARQRFRPLPSRHYLLHSRLFLQFVVDDPIAVEIEQEGSFAPIEEVIDHIMGAIPDPEVDVVVTGPLVPSPSHDGASFGMCQTERIVDLV